MNRLTRAAIAAAALLIVVTLAPSLSAQELFDVPLRVNMGGPEVIDAEGNIWIGDGGGPGDALGIRPDDAGGTNTIPDWCVPTAESLEALGFDAADPVSTCFQSIRWDNGADAFDYVLELPVPNGTYEVNLYFCEACCDARHFTVELQDELVADDVHRVVYANAFHEAGRLSFDGITVTEELLRIALRPCPDCPGAADVNAILSAFELLTGAECDPPEFPFNFTCVYNGETDRVEGNWNAVDNAEGYRVLKNGDVLIPNLPANITSFVDTNPDQGAGAIDYTLQALDGGEVFAECHCTIDPRSCPSDLVCELDGDTGDVTLSWVGPAGVDVVSYDIMANGVTIASVSPPDVSYVDTPVDRSIRYEVVPITDPAGDCRTLSCTIDNTTILLEAPIRVNAGGPEIVDSFGRVWLGDEGAGLDPLNIRPDDIGGINTIAAWCAPEPATVEAAGLDPSNPNDVNIFRSIRWDLGADGVDFVIELPVENGRYDITLYFCESCCPQRHFKIALQDEVVVEDVSQSAYAAGPNQVGRYRFRSIVVENRLLRIALLPCPDCDCPECVGDRLMDINALLSAFEVVSAGGDPCAEEGFRVCTSDFQCALDDENGVSGTWTLPECFDAQGFRVLKNGELLEELPGTATSFADLLDTRVAVYELVPISSDPDFSCAGVGMMCQVVDLACPFEGEVRINMGGPPMTDSAGRVWLGDAGAGLDPLDLRVDDLGGTNAVFNWVIGNLQPASMADDDLDPESAADRSLISTIRWDPADGTNWVMEIPVANDVYSVTLWFTENFHDTPEIRQFGLVVEGEVISANFSTLDYSPDNPVTGWAGSITLEEVDVTDGSLSISFPECDAELDCPQATDRNAILSLLHFAPVGGDDDRPRFVRGDTNSSGVIDLTDGIMELNWLFLGGRFPLCLDAADTDNNGGIVISDAVIIFSYLFTGGTPPVEPSPSATNYPASDCAVDPPDGRSLGCASPAEKCN